MYSIDQHKVFHEIGFQKIVELSTAFYRRVGEDPDPVFRRLFPPDLHEAIQNQYEFLTQRLGGPQLYTQRKGHPALRARHAPFKITAELAQHWLELMRAAMAEVGISGETAAALDEYFSDTAMFLVNTGADGRSLS